MLQDQIKLMLKSLTHDKRTFKTFYKTGFFSYSKGNSSVGEVAIVNDKAIISFLQDSNDESKVIATATFQNGYTLVLRLSGENFSQYRFGKSPAAHEDIGCAVLSTPQGRDAVIADISSIIKHCAEAKEKSSSTSFQSTISKHLKALSSSSEKISQQEVKAMIETTIDKLEKVQSLSKRDKVSPHINPSSLSDVSIENQYTSNSHTIPDTSR